MRTTMFLSLLVLVGGCSADEFEDARNAPSTKFGPFLGVSLADACRLAGEQNKLVFVDFYAHWVGRCRMQDEATWQVKAVEDFLDEKTIPIRIPVGGNPPMANHYKLVSFPVMLFLRPDGSEIERLEGYFPAEQFLKEAVGSMAGKSSMDRAREHVATGDGDEPGARLDLGRELAARGEHEEALVHFLWCWDHGGESQYSFGGVRGSYLISDLKDLAAVYPETRLAIAERRDAIAEELLAGDVGWLDAGELARDLGDLNTCLDETAHSLEVFDRLAGQGYAAEKGRAALLDDLLDSLIEARRYADILAVSGPVSARVSSELRHFNDSLRMFPDDPSIKPHLVRQASRWYEILIGAGNGALAESIAKRILRFDDSIVTLGVLADRAERAGNDAASAKWRSRIR